MKALAFLFRLPIFAIGFVFTTLYYGVMLLCALCADVLLGSLTLLGVPLQTKSGVVVREYGKVVKEMYDWLTLQNFPN